MSAMLSTASLVLAECLFLSAVQPKPTSNAPPGIPMSQLDLGKGDRIIARHREGVSGVSFSPDGKLLATAGGDSVIRLWNLETGKEVRRFEGHHGFIRTVVFSPDGKLLASAGDDPTIFLWDPATGKEVRRVGKHKGNLRLAVFSPDGRTLASSGFEDNVGLWDVVTGKELHRFQAHPRVAYSVAFSPDGRVLASGGDNEGTIRLWDVAAGKEVRHWNGHTGCVFSVAFSPDGRLLASGGGDNAARLWEVATGKEVHRLDGHRNGVVKVAFAPDGRTLVSASQNETAHLWETMTGKEIRSFGKHTGWVWDVAYSPTGRAVASGGQDTTAVVWELGSGGPTLTRRPVELTAAELDRAWRELAGADAGRAFQAALALPAAPRQVVPFLKERLRPAPTVLADPEIERLTRLLDNNVFMVRENAGKELERLGDRAGPALRKALTNPPSLEARRRLEALLAKLEGGDFPPERLQALRAVRVLEDLDTPETRRLLKELAAGSADDLLTREAAAAFARVARRPPP